MIEREPSTLSYAEYIRCVWMLGNAWRLASPRALASAGEWIDRYQRSRVVAPF